MEFSEAIKMTIGLLGKKCGMTRIYNEDGGAVPVTVIEVLPHYVTQVKKMDTDGYNAIQVTTGKCKRTRLSKAETGHFSKAGVEPGSKLWEFPLSDGAISQYTVGAELNLSHFSVGQFVDVTGTSKGKGFAGTVKRHNFRTQDASHGNSLSHRVPGSIGQRQTPGKVWKNKRMAGQMGNVNKTILSQEVIRIDAERHLILIKGSVPGATQNYVLIRPAVKKPLEE